MIATMTKPDTYYTPARIRALCRLYPYLTSSRPPADPETQALVRQGFSSGTWQEEAACKRADIWRALRWLEEQEGWETAYCIRGHLIVGLAQRYVADYLSSQTGDYWHQRRVSRAVNAGTILMSRYLSGEFDAISFYQEI